MARCHSRSSAGSSMPSSGSDAQCSRRSKVWDGEQRSAPGNAAQQHHRSWPGKTHHSGVGRGGVEPPTFRFSGGRSYRLSYLPATPTGLEPATSAVTGRRANQLRYGARHGRTDRGTTVPDCGAWSGTGGRAGGQGPGAWSGTGGRAGRARRAGSREAAGEGQAAGAWAGGAVAVIGVGETAAVEGQATAADAVGEVVTQLFEAG